MKKISLVAALILVAFTTQQLISPAQANPAPPTFTFTFDDMGNNTFPNQTQSTAILTPSPACPADPCNSSTSFGIDSQYGSYWEWSSTNPRGGGFTVDTTGLIGDTYSIAMTFTLSQVSGWRKIIDYLNRSSDTGFYVLSGALQFYPQPTANFSFSPNQLINLVAVRDAISDPNNPTFKVYLAGPGGNYTQVYSFIDSTNMAVPYSTAGHTILGFFFDDTATTSEAANSGRIYDLRMWQNSALSANDLNYVYNSAIAQPTQNNNTVATPAPTLPSEQNNNPANEARTSLSRTGQPTTLIAVLGLFSLSLGGILFQFIRRRKI